MAAGGGGGPPREVWMLISSPKAAVLDTIYKITARCATTHRFHRKKRVPRIGPARAAR
jgi:hypothetical protein